MTIEEIKAVLASGTSNHFGDDVEAEMTFLHGALSHALDMLDTAVQHVDDLRKEWRDIECSHRKS